MGNEHDLRDAIRRFLNVEEQAKRCFAFKVHGGKFQRAGIPDWIVFLPGGRIFLAETKNPNGGELSAMQVLVRKKLEKLGHLVWVPTTMDEFKHLYYYNGGRTA